MNDVVKEIERYKSGISNIEFQDHMTTDDYKKVSEYKDKIKELKKQMIGLSGVVVKCSYKDKEHYATDGFYLTNNPILCCCSEPTIFDNKDEAREYLQKAKLSDGMYDIQFINMKYTDSGWEEV